MDATKMTFPDCTFDVAIDKSDYYSPPFFWGGGLFLLLIFFVGCDAKLLNVSHFAFWLYVFIIVLSQIQ